MIIAFKPIKIRKSFLTKKAVWVSGKDLTNNTYIKGLIHKNKETFIKTIIVAKDTNKALVISANIVKNKDDSREDIIWFNPGTQEQIEITRSNMDTELA